RLNIAGALITAGHADRALVEAQAALSIDESVRGPDHAETAYALLQVGDAERHLGDLERARPTLERALAILDKGAWDQRLISDAAMALGAVWLAEGDQARARPLLERTLAIRERMGTAAALADARVALAMTMWDVDRTRARALIDQARPRLDPRSEYVEKL